jgi:hypothetical protein
MRSGWQHLPAPRDRRRGSPHPAASIYSKDGGQGNATQPMSAKSTTRTVVAAVMIDLMVMRSR